MGLKPCCGLRVPGPLAEANGNVSKKYSFAEGRTNNFRAEANGNVLKKIIAEYSGG